MTEPRTRLEELAIKYSVDKYHFHSYIPYYHQLFTQYRWDKPTKRLLEIGIGYEHLMAPLVPRYIHGASLKMWEEYLPDAHIFSCDIRSETMVNEGRITSVVCDQSKPLELLAMVGEFGGDFDIVIDDGSHVHEHQMITAATLLPFMALHGTYVIEDVWEDKAHRLAERFGGVVYKGGKRGDDCLVVIGK